MRVKARHVRLTQLSTLNTQLSTGLHLLPAFTPECGIGIRPMNTWAGSPCHYSRIGPIGKSYPVTAAQLLPIRTGFLAPIHFSKLAKNWIENYRLAVQASRLFNHMP